MLQSTLGSTSAAGSAGGTSSLEGRSGQRVRPSALSLLPSLVTAVIWALPQELAFWSWGGEPGASQPPGASVAPCFPQSPLLCCLPQFEPESHPEASLDGAVLGSPLPHAAPPSSPFTCGAPGWEWPRGPTPTGPPPQPGMLRMGLGGSCLLV